MSNIFHGVRTMAGSETYPEVAVNEIRDGFDFAASKLPSLAGLNKDLVSLWRMDVPSGIRIDSVGPNHLTDNNTVTQAKGKIGNCAVFASANSEWLNCIDNDSLLFTTQFSASLWLKQTSLVANMAIMGQWDYQTQGSWMIETDSSTDEVRVYIADALTDAGNNRGATTDANMTTATWYHIVVVYDGTLTGNANRLKIYHNGVLKTLSFTGTIAATLQNSTADLKFGKFGGTLDRYLNGSIDAVRLYARAITAAEVALLFNSGAGIE